MNCYVPDHWVLIEILGNTPHYKVFGAWSGSYMYADSWRMNSGITKVTEDAYDFKFYGSSGSCYICNKKRYGLNPYGYGVYQHYKSQLGDKFNALTEEEALNVIKADNWIINNPK